MPPRKQTTASEGGVAGAAMEAPMLAMDLAPGAADEQDDYEEDVAFLPIEKLAELGVNAGDLKKAKDAGFHTVNCIMMNTKKTLGNIKGLSEAKVDKLVEAAQKLLPGQGFVTGQQMLEKRKDVVCITTGCKALDAVMGGGVRSMEITEAFGEFRTGKTQICHTLCVTTQMPRSMGGGAGKVAYIDTEGTFRPDRIIPIAERFGVDPAAVLENIVVSRVYTHEHQMNQLFLVCAKMVEEPFRLIIIDSIMALFRVDFSGRGELAERQQKLGQMMSRLQKIAEEFNVAIFVTNHVISDPGGGMTFVQDPKKPIGGHVMAHASTVRLSLRKGKGEQRICKLFDSPDMPESEATYQISNGGIIDPCD